MQYSGWPPSVTHRSHMPLFSQTQWTSCKRWSLKWAAQTVTYPCSLRLQRLLWIYCPGHAGVSANEQADRLASTADITSGLHLGRAEVPRGLRNFLNMDRPEHRGIDHLKERGVEKGSSRHSTLQGRERSVFNQANIGTVLKVTVGKRLRDGAERVWAFPSATMPSWAETETDTNTTHYIDPYHTHMDQWSQAAPTGTLLCTPAFGCKEFCASVARPQSDCINRQIDLDW